MIRHDHYDAVVVGVGGMGSATAFELARRGRSVLAVEKHNVPTSQGSSGGYSRVISRSFYDREEHMRLYERAYELWEGIERNWGGTVLHAEGSLTTGRPGTPVIETAKDTCERFDIPHERLTPAAATDRFPGYDVPSDHEVIYQPTDGFLVPRDGVRACVDLAHRHGAEIHARTAVRGWSPADEGGVSVQLDGPDHEATVTADALVVTAGAWTPKIVEVAADVLEAERQVLGRFQPDKPEAFTPEQFPVSAITTDNGQYSAFPIHGEPGVKVTRVHHRRETVDPDRLDDTVTEADSSVLRWFGDRFLAGGTGPTMRLETCLYTNTPDERFIADTHPDHPQVCLAAGFSGDGYKFCPVVGEIMADLATEGDTDHPIEPFRFDRF
jgi:sarcosine oxidase